MLKKLLGKWRMRMDSADEITAMTIDIDQAERDYIDTVRNMPGSNSGIADYYRIRRLRRIADRMNSKRLDQASDPDNPASSTSKEQRD